MELRGTQYGEVVLSQIVSPHVLTSFTRTGATAWGWRDPRLREQFELTLDTELDWDRFKAAMDDLSRKKSLQGFFQNLSGWYFK